MDETTPLPQIPAARTCPFAPPTEYQRLGHHEPVTAVALPSGKTAWAITRLRDVRAMLIHPDVSSDPRRPGFPDAYPDPADDDTAALPQLIEMDPPQHTLYRRMLVSELTARRVNDLRPDIQRLVDDLIGGMLLAGPPVDLVSAFALAIPSTVICQLLGVPYDDHRFFQTRTEVLVSTTVGDDEKATAYADLLDYLDHIVTAKEADPTDDILGRLITNHVATGALSHEMLVNTAAFLLLAGHESTASTIALGVLTFLQHPAQRALLTTDPEAVAGAADEMVRYHSLGDVDVARTAAADFELGGKHVKAGDGLLPILSAANRDPAAFDHPDDVDITRPNPRQHVGFGYGPHLCLGHNLARAQLEIAYRSLFDRIPTLRLAVPVEELHLKTDSQIFGLHAMPVTW